MKQRFMCFLLLVCVCFGAMALPVGATAASVDLDAFLRERGVPEDVLETMPWGQKQLIYDTVGDGAMYVPYEEDHTVLSSTADDALLTAMGMDGLEFFVVAFEWTEDGRVVNDVYTSFVWTAKTLPNLDTFETTLYPGWEAVPGERVFRFYTIRSSGDVKSVQEFGPIGASHNGYTYGVPTSASARTYYEGHSYLRVMDTKGDSTHAVVMRYKRSASHVRISYPIAIVGLIVVGAVVYRVVTVKRKKMKS